MPDILLHALAAALYLGLAYRFWQLGWSGPVLNAPASRIGHRERATLLVALVLHALTLRSGLFADGQMHFGFAIALSVMMWLATVLYWLESFYARMDGLHVIALPLTALAVLLPAVFDAPHVLPNAGSVGFRLHFLTAMLAYSLFTLAALHALLMAAVERALHKGQLPPFLAGLPPLLTMEALLFRLIYVGFGLLTFTVISGAMFSESLFGQAFTFTHKTLFALISWAIFAALIVGRHLRGWRGRVALRWTIAGFIALMLAYVGSRFVLDVLLGRS
jgi:ABC-type uncharacterized transport system permease subunit